MWLSLATSVWYSKGFHRAWVLVAAYSYMFPLYFHNRTNSIASCKIFTWFLNFKTIKFVFKSTFDFKLFVQLLSRTIQHKQVLWNKQLFPLNLLFSHHLLTESKNNKSLLSLVKIFYFCITNITEVMELRLQYILHFSRQHLKRFIGTTQRQHI